MARKINKRSPKSAFIIIADGEDERWYLTKVKEHYPNEVLKHTKLKPEMSQSKKSKDLFLAAKERIDEGYTHVALIIDLDTIRKDDNDFDSFKTLYQRYQNVKKGVIGRNDKWMLHLSVFINNPCLEYWYLLHFKQTSKFFEDYDSLKREMKRIPALSDYDKSEAYYFSNPDIFNRLGGDIGLGNARLNSASHCFDIMNCCFQGVTEMRLLFDLFDKL